MFVRLGSVWFGAVRHGRELGLERFGGALLGRAWQGTW
jgi:hypothetical protein